MTFTKVIALGFVGVLGFGSAGFASTELTPSDQIRQLAGQSGAYRVVQSCPYSGTIACAPGPQGPGGCYNPSYAECAEGLICTGGMKVCYPSNGASAFCYAPQNGNCH